MFVDAGKNRRPAHLKIISSQAKGKTREFVIK